MTLRRATLEQDGWELESGVARHQAAPETFWIPSQIERASVKPGQAVKLLFLIELEEPDVDTDVECERMWVLVSEKVGEHYRGFLDSEPAAACNLTVGQEVYFSPEHIIDIGDPPGEYYEERIRYFTA
jgi:uncharacterized protein YegJ (DUF2314 family)